MDVEDLENRFRYHPPTTEARRTAHERVRAHCLGLALEINENVPDGREKSLAITNLEQVMFWANAALARSSDEQG